jgi:hypothetical protein
MSMTDNTPGQGSSGGTDIVTQLTGIVRQFSNANTNTLALIAALQAAFPRTVLGYTVATLPASPAIGTLAYVTDGAGALAWGANISGGGAATYLVFWNGTHFTVAGK